MRKKIRESRTVFPMKREVIIVCCASFLTLCCTQNQQEKQKPEIGQQVPDASRDFGKSVVPPTQAQNTSGKITPVDFHDLQALLPEKVLTLKCEANIGETSDAFGFTMSTAEGQYDDEEGRSLTIKITDLGSLQSLASMSIFSWAMNDIDRKTSTGYEKTIKYHGCRAYEKTDQESSELNVLVADRFVIEIDGYQLDMDDLKAALALIDLSKFESMKSYGIP